VQVERRRGRLNNHRQTSKACDLTVLPVQARPDDHSRREAAKGITSNATTGQQAHDGKSCHPWVAPGAVVSQCSCSRWCEGGPQLSVTSLSRAAAAAQGVGKVVRSRADLQRRRLRRPVDSHLPHDLRGAGAVKLQATSVSGVHS
jgi:hypothetical protein